MKNRLQWAISTDETRESLTGLRIEVNPDGVRYIGCNGHVLAIEDETRNLPESGEYLVDGKILKEKIAKDSLAGFIFNGSVEFSSDGQTSHDVSMNCRYPDIKRVMDDTKYETAPDVIFHEESLEVLNVVCGLLKADKIDKLPSVTLQGVEGNDSIIITVERSGYTFTGSLKAAVYQDVTIGIDPNYLFNCINNGCKRFHMHEDGNTKLMKFASTCSPVTYYVMPLRINK